MITKSIFLVLWFICGFVNAGFVLNFFQKNYIYPSKEETITDYFMAICIFIAGIAGVIGCILLSIASNNCTLYKHGWSLKPYKKGKE